MRISDWSSDVCSSDLPFSDKALPGRVDFVHPFVKALTLELRKRLTNCFAQKVSIFKHTPIGVVAVFEYVIGPPTNCHERSAAHTSELQSLIRTSYSVSCF